jgi:hypothetical protein
MSEREKANNRCLPPPRPASFWPSWLTIRSNGALKEHARLLTTNAVVVVWLCCCCGWVGVNLRTVDEGRTAMGKW